MPNAATQPRPVAHLLPPPPQLARDYEAGVLTQRQFQAAMSLHASEIIDEVIEARRNPLAAYLDELLNRRAAAKLVRRYSEVELRAAFVALSQVPGFPPASLLWNAGHWDIPFSCFIRVRREPVFRVGQFSRSGEVAKLSIVHGGMRRPDAIPEEFSLARDIWGRYRVVGRTTG